MRTKAYITSLRILERDFPESRLAPPKGGILELPSPAPQPPWQNLKKQPPDICFGGGGHPPVHQHQKLPPAHPKIERHQVPEKNCTANRF